MAASTSKGGACMIINNEKDVTTAVLSELARAGLDCPSSPIGTKTGEK